jgi:hypothetical protein
MKKKSKQSASKEQSIPSKYLSFGILLIGLNASAQVDFDSTYSSQQITNQENNLIYTCLGLTSDLARSNSFARNWNGNGQSNEFKSYEDYLNEAKKLYRQSSNLFTPKDGFDVSGPIRGFKEDLSRDLQKFNQKDSARIQTESDLQNLISRIREFHAKINSHRNHFTNLDFSFNPLGLKANYEMQLNLLYAEMHFEVEQSIQRVLFSKVLNCSILE